MYIYKILFIYLNVNNYKYVKKVIVILEKFSFKLNCYVDYGIFLKLYYLLINVFYYYNKIINIRIK